MKLKNYIPNHVTIWARAQHFLQLYLCAQSRLRSACSSAQSDHSLCWSHEDWVFSYPQNGQQRLIRLCRCAGWSVFAGHTCNLVGNDVPTFKCQCLCLQNLSLENYAKDSFTVFLLTLSMPFKIIKLLLLMKFWAQLFKANDIVS